MVDSSLRMEMKALIVRTSDSNLEHLLMVLYSRSKVQHLSLYYQYTLVVEPLTLVVKVLINIPKFTLAKVLYSDLFLLQNLLLLRVLLLDYFPSMVQQKKRIQRFTLERVLYSHSSAKQNPQLFRASLRLCSDSQVRLRTNTLYSVILELEHSLHSVVLLITKELPSITTKTPLLMLNMKIMDSLLQQLQTRRLVTMLINQSVIMLMK